MVDSLRRRPLPNNLRRLHRHRSDPLPVHAINKRHELGLRSRSACLLVAIALPLVSAIITDGELKTRRRKAFCLGRAALLQTPFAQESEISSFATKISK